MLLKLIFRTRAQAESKLVSLISQIDQDEVDVSGDKLKGPGFKIYFIGDIYSNPTIDSETFDVVPGERLGVARNGSTTWYYHVDLYLTPPVLEVVGTEEKTELGETYDIPIYGAGIVDDLEPYKIDVDNPHHAILGSS